MATTNTTTIDSAMPPLNLEQVRQKLLALLSDAGDLSAYIEQVTDGKVVVKNFTLPVQPGCSTLPKTTLIGQQVPDQRLERVRDAILSVNEDFRLGRPLRLEVASGQPACFDSDGMEIRGATASPKT
jgi:hypothetical protein